MGINPELFLEINGVRHIIKLYFKSDPLSQQKAHLILHLLDLRAGRYGKVGVLDLRRGKLFVPTKAVEGMDALLDSEAAAFVALWNAI